MELRTNTASKITSLITIVLSLLVITAVGTGTIYSNQAQGQQLTFAQFQAQSPQTNSDSPATTTTPPLEDDIAATVTQQPNASSTASTTFSTYSSPEFGFTIQHPSDWRVLPSVSPTQIVSFISPFENLQDIIPVGVIISRNDYLSNVTLEGYTQLNLDILQSIGANISQSSPTTLSGMPAHMVLTNNTAVTGTVDMLIWSATTDGQKVYTITYSATPEDFEQYRSIFNEMVNSFQIMEEERGDSDNNMLQQPQQQQQPSSSSS